MEPVIGLKIEYTSVQKKGSEVKLLVANIKVSRGVPSKTFITSPIIREALSTLNPTEKIKFEGIVAEYTPSTKILRITSYYPIPSIKGTPDERFSGRGIAERIESRVVEMVEKTFPDFEKVTHFNASKFRKEQLKKRNHSVWEIWQGIKRKEFVDALREKVAFDLRVKRRMR